MTTDHWCRSLRSAGWVAMLWTLLAGAEARAQTDPPPPDIQAIFDKLQSHKPVNPEELRKLQVWTLRKSNGTDANPAAQPAESQNPAMPPDVQEILARAQAGHKPSDAEKARLQAWGAATRAKKNALRDDANATHDQLQRAAAAATSGASPRAPRPPSVPLNGTLTLDIRQSIKAKGAVMNYVATASIPFLYRIVDPQTAADPAFHFQWFPDPKRAASLQYNVNGQAPHDPGKKDCPPHIDTVAGSVSFNGPAQSGMVIANGQIVMPKGRRSYTDVMLASIARGPYHVSCQCGDTATEAGPVLLQLSYDQLRGDVPFNYGVGNLPVTGNPIRDKLPPEIRDTIDHAKFDFDAGAMRKAISKGGPYDTTAKYDWHTEIKGGVLDSHTTLHFTLQLAPVDNKIIVTPDPPARADHVTLQVHVAGATKYHWTVTPKACGDESVPGPFQSDDQQLDFVALCDFTASVKPSSDSGDLDPPPDKDVTVTMRDWKTQRLHKPIRYFTHPLMQAKSNDNQGELQPDGDLHLGESACAVDESEGMVVGRHWIHHPHDTQDYQHPKSEGGFEVSTASSGPWKSWAYVKAQGLKLDRVKLVNEDLKPGSALWNMNVAAANAVKTKKPDIQALASELMDHEQAHEDLAFAALDSLDPAPKIEKMIRADEQTLSTDASRVCADAESRIADAANHEHVKARLGQWNHSGYVLLPEPGGYRTFVIGNYAELGASPP